MLPIVAVQVAPADAAPTLAEHLLQACSAGLSRARCVPARDLDGQAPHGVAIVSWTGAEHVSIEVGLAGAADGAWVSRALDFVPSDPENERWRAVGFTIALLADDPRFWPTPEPVVSAPVTADAAPVDVTDGSSDDAERHALSTELRGLAGTGLVSGPWRWGAELRLAVPVSGPLFLTGSVDYSLADDVNLEVRWFDATAGAGLLAPNAFWGLDVRARLELLAQNVAVRVEQDTLTDRRTTWVPGVSLGGDLLYPLGGGWQLSARGDVFWLDGSTGITVAGRPIGATAGAGVLLGLGAGHRF